MVWGSQCPSWPARETCKNSQPVRTTVCSHACMYTIARRWVTAREELPREVAFCQSPRAAALAGPSPNGAAKVSSSGTPPEPLPGTLGSVIPLKFHFKAPVSCRKSRERQIYAQQHPPRHTHFNYILYR